MIVIKKWKETLNTSYSGKFNLHFKVYCCFVFNFLNSFFPFQVFLSLICIGTAAGKENSNGRDEGKQPVARWGATSQSAFIAKTRVLWKGRDQQFLQGMSWSHFYIGKHSHVKSSKLVSEWDSTCPKSMPAIWILNRPKRLVPGSDTTLLVILLSIEFTFAMWYEM